MANIETDRGLPGGRTRRGIGPAGTTGRLLVGGAMVGAVLDGHLTGTFDPQPWILGLAGLPGLLLGWQGWRARRHPGRLVALTGPFGHVATTLAFFVLYAGLSADAALLFFGSSMLLAAVRGYAGCEVLAIPNWLLGRDDQVGCLLFGPLDHLERSSTRS